MVLGRDPSSSHLQQNQSPSPVRQPRPSLLALISSSPRMHLLGVQCPGSTHRNCTLYVCEERLLLSRLLPTGKPNTLNNISSNNAKFSIQGIQLRSCLLRPARICQHQMGGLHRVRCLLRSNVLPRALHLPRDRPEAPRGSRGDLR
jgi:hypothetical protein